MQATDQASPSDRMRATRVLANLPRRGRPGELSPRIMTPEVLEDKNTSICKARYSSILGQEKLDSPCHPLDLPGARRQKSFCRLAIPLPYYMTFNTLITITTHGVLGF